MLTIQKIVIYFSVLSLLCFPSSAASLVVTTLEDIADGDASSVTELIAAPGADGAISLREAIQATNGTAGADYIGFGMPGVINVTSPLPALMDTTGGTTIDGNGLIRLDGESIKESSHGLVVQSADNQLLGLTITRFPVVGVFIDGPDARNNRVAGCKIGTDGTIGLGNKKGPGVHITNGAKGNVIGGATPTERNIISANWSAGIYMDYGADDNVIKGNYVGLTEDGTTALINIGVAIPDEVYSSIGIMAVFGASSNIIGGSGVGEGNLISANHVEAIRVDSPGSRFNVIRGNHIVFDPDASNYHGFDMYPYLRSGIRCGAFSSNNIVGGHLPGEGNIIDGYWERFGIDIFYSDNNIIQGNVLTDGPAHVLFVNRAGIAVDHSTGNLIGGAEPGAGNVVHGRFDTYGLRMNPNNIARGNSITANDDVAILVDGEGLAPPTVLGLAPIHGTAPACTLIDLYADEEDEARVYLGAVRTDSCGRFVARDIDLSPYVGLNLTATVTHEWDWMTSALTPPMRIEQAHTLPPEVDPFPYDPLCECAMELHSADYDSDGSISLSELLRVIQFFNSDEGFHCDDSTEDGFAIGDGPHDCAHNSDYVPRDWQINLTELLRSVQIYNIGGYQRCPDTEDGYCPVPPPDPEAEM